MKHLSKKDFADHKALATKDVLLGDDQFVRIKALSANEALELSASLSSDDDDESSLLKTIAFHVIDPDTGARVFDPYDDEELHMIGNLPMVKITALFKECAKISGMGEDEEELEKK